MCVCARVRVCLVTQLYPTLCNPMDCSPSGSSVHRIFQARILELLSFPSPGNVSHPGIKPVSLVSPALQADSLPVVPPGKAANLCKLHKSISLWLVLSIRSFQFLVTYLCEPTRWSRWCFHCLIKFTLISISLLLSKLVFFHISLNMQAFATSMYQSPISFFPYLSIIYLSNWYTQ